MTNWSEIVADHKTVLWGTAYRILGNCDDSLDCCQDALLDAYRYSQKNSVENWRSLLKWKKWAYSDFQWDDDNIDPE